MMGTQSATRMASTVPGSVGDQGVGGRDGVVQGQRAASLVGRGHDRHPAAVRLLAEHEVSQVRAERGGHPAPVHQHVGGLIADVQPEVERAVGAG